MITLINQKASSSAWLRIFGLYLKKSVWLVIISLLFQACKKEINAPHGSVTATPKLSSSADQLTLAQADTAKTTLTLNWSAAGVSGTTGKIVYVLEFDKKGNNFANPVRVKIGGDTTRITYTVKQLNNLLEAYPINTPINFEVRVVTATSDGAVMPFFSNVVNLNVSTFADVPYHQLWLVGDATPNGWDISNATPMSESTTDPFVFSYTGPLTAGEFKIATAKDFNGLFYRPTSNHPSLSATAVQVSAGNPDNKWQITPTYTGTYTINLNLRNNTINIIPINIPKPPYNQLWLIGDATAGGWSLNNMTPMVQSAADPFVFTVTTNLVAGDFKIATAKDFNAPFYRPQTNYPDLSVTTIKLNAGDPDNKWHITTATAGKYTITLNLRDNSIKIVFQPAITTPPYSKLWLIGDATPGGWSLDNMTPMTQDATNPFVFTYTGNFVAGEFKIATTNDFGAPFYRPTSNHPDLSATDVQVTAGDPDNKWLITTSTAGKYKILLNTQNNTIAITKQ